MYEWKKKITDYGNVFYTRGKADVGHIVSCKTSHEKELAGKGKNKF